VITNTISNQGRFWPRYYYGPTRIEVTLASPNCPGFASPSRALYEVIVVEGPKYPRPKRRTLLFACKFNPHRNAPRFLPDLFVRLARSDDPAPFSAFYIQLSAFHVPTLPHVSGASARLHKPTRKHWEAWAPH
jgi:hypothetical protein